MNLVRHYLPFLKPHWKPFAIGAFCAILVGLTSGFGVPFFIDRVFRHIFDRQDQHYGLWRLIGIASLLPLAFIFRGAALYFNQYFISLSFLRVLQDLRLALFDKLQRLSLGYYERQATGDLMSRLMADTNQIQTALMTISAEGIRQPFIVVFGVGYLVYMSIEQRQALFLLLLVGLIPVSAAMVRQVGKQLRHRGRQVQVTLGQLTQDLSENLRASVEVRAFALEDAQRRRFADRLAQHFRVSLKVIKYDKIAQPLLEIVAVIAISAAFVYAYHAGIDFTTFAALGAALYFTGDAVRKMVRTLNIVQRSEGSVERVDQVLAEPEDIAEPAAPIGFDSTRGEIRFEQVCFGYGDVPLFSNLSVAIPPGQVVALVGPSGAGKTTFAKLVPRFYDIQQGHLRVDGVDVRQASLRSLRQRIALVPQAPVLFDDTIANNIRIGRLDATDAEVRAAAEAAYAHDFITQLPAGYDTLVGENGVRLSGGQRQRLAVARAFLKDAPILILDEATSALDSESEARIQMALERLVVGKTVLVIAHRFSTLKLCQRLLVFDRGQIVGDGTHDKLMTSLPLYRDLYERQL